MTCPDAGDWIGRLIVLYEEVLRSPGDRPLENCDPIRGAGANVGHRVLRVVVDTRPDSTARTWLSQILPRNLARVSVGIRLADGAIISDATTS